MESDPVGVADLVAVCGPSPRMTDGHPFGQELLLASGHSKGRQEESREPAKPEVDMNPYQTISFLLAALIPILLFSRRKSEKNDLSPPGITTLFFGLDNGLSFLRSTVEFLEEARAQYGPVFSFNVLGIKFVFLMPPATAVQLERQTDALDMSGEFARAMTAASGLYNVGPMVSVLVDRLFPLITPNASMRHLSSEISAQRISEIFDNELADLTKQGSVSLPFYEFIGRTSYKALSTFLLGSTFPCDTYDDFKETFDNIIPLTFHPTSYLPFYRPKEARNRLLARMTEYIRPCWDSEADISLVLQDPHNLIVETISILRTSGLSIREGAGILVAFLFGLHPNVWYHQYHLMGHLLINPGWRAMVEEEVRSGTEVPAMKLLESAMHESIRRPYRILQVRHTTADVEVQLGEKRYLIEKNTTIFAKSMNHEHALYREPFQFKPDRFLDPSTPKPRGFGDGYHICKGRDLAKWELMHFAAACFRNCDMKLLDQSRRPVEISSLEDASFPQDSSVITVFSVPKKDDYYIQLNPRNQD